MSRRFMDFDEFFAEASGGSDLVIKLFDKEYTIPADVPASIILELYRMAENGEAEVSDAKQMQMAIGMLGEENVKEWCEKKISIRKLGQIMKWVMAQTTAEAEEEVKKNIQKITE